MWKFQSEPMVRVAYTVILLQRTLSRQHALLNDLKGLSAYWHVAIGGQGARAIEHFLENSGIELLDDLAALHHRITILLSAPPASFAISL